MDEAKKQSVKAEEELVELLLEFIIVAAMLAKKANRSAMEKQIKEGGNGYEQSKRVGSCNQGSAFRCRHY